MVHPLQRRINILMYEDIKISRTWRHHAHSTTSRHTTSRTDRQLIKEWLEHLITRSNTHQELTAFFLSSSTTGGGPSTLMLTTVSPRKMTSPSVRFISCSGAVSSPGFFLGRTLLNSSQSA